MAAFGTAATLWLNICALWPTMSTGATEGHQDLQKAGHGWFLDDPRWQRGQRSRQQELRESKTC
jgi:hypothetical protein